MQVIRGATMLFLTVFFASVPMATGQERDRGKIPEKYKWNLADIYPSDDAWRSAKARLVADIPTVRQYRGKLAESAQNLYACLDLISRLSKEYLRLSSYASMHADEDTRKATYLGMQQEMSQVGSEFGAQAAFVDPEVLTMDRSTIESLIKSEPKLEVYRHQLDETLRQKEHTGTEGEEKIIADASLMSDTPDNVFSIFSNAEFPFPQLTLADGKTVKLDKAAFNLYRTVPNREDRQKVFATYFNRLNDYRRTFGTQLYGEVKKDMFYTKARKYRSCLESALDRNNIPVEVYKSLVANVDAHLATFHRYLNLKKRLLGISELHYYDLYAPMVKNVDLTFSIDEAKKHVLASLAPLGSEYVAVAKKAFDERWVDVYPSDGKRAGAYSNGSAYDVHPYMLLNYNGKYDDMSALAHELGHTMHSYLSNTSQAYPNAQYSIFVAEVASTCNEALLLDYMLKTEKDDQVRLSLLGSYLEGVRGTLFRQVQFAEFEMRIHEMAEKGETLTGDSLNALYDRITKKYYGHDKGVTVVDDDVKAEWANIPHFYYNFYVYQYATSVTASSALSEQVIAGDKAATARYLTLLKSGGSDYPINLLKKAGVDMTTSEPFDLMVKKMNRIMDEMEAILNRMGKK